MKSALIKISSCDACMLIQSYGMYCKALSITPFQILLELDFGVLPVVVCARKGCYIKAEDLFVYSSKQGGWHPNNLCL